MGDTGAFFGVGDIHVGETAFYGRSFFGCRAARSRAAWSARTAPAEDHSRMSPSRRTGDLKNTVAFPYPAPRNDVLAAYIEASNGAPSHLLVADKLEKF